MLYCAQAGRQRLTGSHNLVKSWAYFSPTTLAAISVIEAMGNSIEAKTK
jgi:hypothetical protein